MFDRQGVDWVGVGYLDELRLKEDRSWWEKLITWAVKREGNLAVVSFLVYSVFVDPFIVAVHYRHNHFNGITRRDWGLLLASVLVGNFYWTVRIGLMVELAKWIWQAI
jgi:predicted neutral ceramidase superfamily lipid hydrolase